MADYSITLVTAATAYPVTVDELKHELRIDHDHDDELLSRYIATATALAEHELAVQIKSATYDYKRHKFPPGHEPILIPMAPISSVTSISYTDEDGNSQTWSSALYETALDRKPAQIRPLDTQDYPETDDAYNTVTVRYVSGYSTIPETIKQAIRTMVVSWYETRDGIGEVSPGSMRLLDAARWIIET